MNTQKQKPNIGPVTLVTPNTTTQKMEAIVCLSHAVCELAKAINGTNVAVEISNCNISSSGAGIEIGPEK